MNLPRCILQRVDDQVDVSGQDPVAVPRGVGQSLQHDDPAAFAAHVAVRAPAEADDANAQKAENEPVLTEQQAAAGGSKNIGGEGAPGEVDRDRQGRRRRCRGPRRCGGR